MTPEEPATHRDPRSQMHPEQPPPVHHRSKGYRALMGPSRLADEGELGPPSPFGLPSRRELVVTFRSLAVGKLLATVGQFQAERGGALVGPDAWTIEDFVFDAASDPKAAVYYPAAEYLNGIIERDHEPYGRRFVGIAHSHPVGLWRPSGDENWGDVKAARNNLLAKGNAHLDALFIPIVESEGDTGRFKIYPFVMLRGDLRVYTARVKYLE